MTLSKTLLRGVGIASIVLAGIGLCYNSVTLFQDYSEILEEHNLPYFYPAFYTMSAICVACYVLLLALGIQFVRLKTKGVSCFILLLVFEITYIFVPGLMWMNPTIGMSIAAATGIANGGLMYQAFVLFPIWAIPAALWAKRKLPELNSERILQAEH